MEKCCGDLAAAGWKISLMRSAADVMTDEFRTEYFGFFSCGNRAILHSNKNFGADVPPAPERGSITYCGIHKDRSAEKRFYAESGGKKESKGPHGEADGGLL